MTLAILTKIVTPVGTQINKQHISVLTKYVEPLTRLMAEYGINTPLRQAHFLAQLAQESGEFKATEENLKYSATRLLQVFPKYFRTMASAQAVAYDGAKIANTVYANRMGNGPKESGDGYAFRGRGLIQLTGHDNYQQFYLHLRSIPTNRLDADTRFALASPDPLRAMADLMTRPELAVRSACWYWQRNRINDLADRGNNDVAITAVTRRVNGGINGLSQRKVYFYRAHLALTSNF